MEPLIVETPRLQLRPLGADDGEALHACFGDVEAMRYWDAPPSRDVAETVERIDKLGKADPRWQAAWAVVLRKSGAVIGFVNCLHRAPWDRRLEIGYILAPPYWRQGLMAEAVRAFVELCFSEFDTHRIEALIEPDNIASIRLVEGLGFRREGRLQDRLLVAGSYRTVMMYALLEGQRDG